MSTLFDVPHPATQSGRPVLWFGVIDTFIDGSSGYRALIADKDGTLAVVPLESVVASARWFEDIEAAAPSLGRKGSGWVDLEDIGPASVDVTSLGKAVVVDLAGGPPETATGNPGVIYDSSGLPYDAETGHPLDT